MHNAALPVQIAPRRHKGEEEMRPFLQYSLSKGSLKTIEGDEE